MLLARAEGVSHRRESVESPTIEEIHRIERRRVGLSRLLRKEVIQPQVPLRLPCYDFTPITNHTLGACLLAVGSATSGTAGFRGVTGGVYKARERIQRSLLICAY
jgi:hypothetical protein